MRKVICLIEIVLLILNVICLIYNYQNGNYKTACLNASAIGCVTTYLIFYLIFLVGGNE